MDLESIDIETISTPLIYKHRFFFSIYLCLLPFLPLMSVSGIWFFSLVRLILKYFIVVDIIVNGIVFCISFGDSPLLVCGNSSGFSLLILHLETTKFLY